MLLSVLPAPKTTSFNTEQRLKAKSASLVTLSGISTRASFSHLLKALMPIDVSAKLPAGLTKLSNLTFSRCSSLTEIEIPATVRF
mgnify:CR=1 FL=1